MTQNSTFTWSTSQLQKDTSPIIFPFIGLLNTTNDTFMLQDSYFQELQKELLNVSDCADTEAGKILDNILNELAKFIDLKKYNNYLEVGMCLKVLTYIYWRWSNNTPVLSFDIELDRNLTFYKNLYGEKMNKDILVEKIVENLCNQEFLKEYNFFREIKKRYNELVESFDNQHETPRALKKKSVLEFIENSVGEYQRNEDVLKFVTSLPLTETRLILETLTKKQTILKQTIGWDAIPQWKRRRELLEELLVINNNRSSSPKSLSPQIERDKQLSVENQGTPSKPDSPQDLQSEPPISPPATSPNFNFEIISSQEDSQSPPKEKEKCPSKSSSPKENNPHLNIDLPIGKKRKISLDVKSNYPPSRLMLTNLLRMSFISRHDIVTYKNNVGVITTRKNDICKIYIIQRNGITKEFTSPTGFARYFGEILKDGWEVVIHQKSGKALGDLKSECYKQLSIQKKETEKESTTPNRLKIRKLRDNEIKVSLLEDEEDFIVKDKTREIESSSDEFVYETDSNEELSELSSFEGSDSEKEPKKDRKKRKSK